MQNPLTGLLNLKEEKRVQTRLSGSWTFFGWWKRKSGRRIRRIADLPDEHSARPNQIAGESGTSCKAASSRFFFYSRAEICRNQFLMDAWGKSVSVACTIFRSLMPGAVWSPNPGQNPDARCAIEVRNWLSEHAPNGEWVQRRASTGAFTVPGSDPGSSIAASITSPSIGKSTWHPKAICFAFCERW